MPCKFIYNYRTASKYWLSFLWWMYSLAVELQLTAFAADLEDSEFFLYYTLHSAIKTP